MEEAEGEDFWRWRFLPSMVAIEARPAAVHEPATPRERSLWYQALLALADQRERLPLNGIVVCVSAARLLGERRRSPPMRHACAGASTRRRSSCGCSCRSICS